MNKIANNKLCVGTWGCQAQTKLSCPNRLVRYKRLLKNWDQIIVIMRWLRILSRWNHELRRESLELTISVSPINQIEGSWLDEVKGLVRENEPKRFWKLLDALDVARERVESFWIVIVHRWMTNHQWGIVMAFILHVASTKQLYYAGVRSASAKRSVS